jgi:hypothetical protein
MIYLFYIISSSLITLQPIIDELHLLSLFQYTQETLHLIRQYGLCIFFFAGTYSSKIWISKKFNFRNSPPSN